LREWVDANNGCRLDILARLRADGPLTARELPDTCVIPWRSSGWTDNRNVLKLIGFLVQRGEVAAVGRRGADRLWDLADRVYPDEVVPSEDALRIRDERRLRALGIARARAPVCPGEPNDVRAAGEPAVVEGVKGQWRVDPELLDRAFTGRAALLSPLDRLVYDRKRMTELFEYDYQLEMLSRPPSAAGVTGHCRSCTATGWSANSTPPPTAGPACSAWTRSTATSPSPRR
jgi:uncharacterized protein YcaQ